MSTEVVIFLSVGECRREYAALSRAQVPVVEERFLPKRSCLPTLHAGSGDRDPVNAASLICEISADVLEAAAAKQLALTRNVKLSFETIRLGIVPVLFKYRPRDPQPGIFFELS